MLHPAASPGTGPGHSPNFMQNQIKSILAIRGQNHNPNGSIRTNELANLRVTFAQAATMKLRSDEIYSAIVNKTPPGTPLAGGSTATTTQSARATTPTNNKYNFGIFPNDPKSRPTTAGKNAGPSSSQTNTEVKKGLTQVRKSGKNISILHAPEKTNLGAGSSTWGLLSRSKSNATSVSSTRSYSTSAKKSSRSVGRSIPKQKTGKKLKKRKKGDKDLEIRPAKLDDEYASELNKITQILRAVSAFDEASGTENGSLNTSASSRNNIVTHYTYMDTSRTSGFADDSSTSNHVRRPLSGNELKQLLSSITRVVSLHQLPVNDASSPGTTKDGGLARNVAGTNTTALPPVSLTDYNRKSLGGNSSKHEESLSPPRKTKSKKSKKKLKSKSLTSQLGAARSRASTISSTAEKRRVQRFYLRKSRSAKDEKAQKVKYRKDSASDTERDPVQNALFLRKYFEESIRLANKQSSEELLEEGQDQEEKKSTKKKKKKKNLPDKSSATITEKDKK